MEEDILFTLSSILDDRVLEVLHNLPISSIISKFDDTKYFWFLRVQHQVAFALELKSEVDWKRIYYILNDSSEKNPFTEEVTANSATLEILLELGYDPTMNDSQSMAMSVENGFTEAVRLLLQDGRADPRSMNNDSFIIASGRGYTDVVQLLLQDGRVDPNIRSEMGKSALESAAYNGRVEVMKLLLADPRISEDSINDVLMVAIDEEEIDSVRLLLEDGRMNQSTIDNAINVAREEGYSREMIDLLM